MAESDCGMAENGCGAVDDGGNRDGTRAATERHKGGNDVAAQRTMVVAWPRTAAALGRALYSLTS